jgi:hypothetical protein
MRWGATGVVEPPLRLSLAEWVKQRVQCRGSLKETLMTTEPDRDAISANGEQSSGHESQSISEVENSGNPFAVDLTTAKMPRAALGVSIYHTVILIGTLLVTTFYVPPTSLSVCTADVSKMCIVDHPRVLTFAFLFGALGSALSASRYVVFAVRHSTYDRRRLLWQSLSPLHGGVLAVVGVYVVFGGILALARAPSPGEEYGFFVGAFAFIVGFSSELFVKRLIRATEALFGEDANIDSVARQRREEDAEKGKPRDRRNGSGQKPPRPVA